MSTVTIKNVPQSLSLAVGIISITVTQKKNRDLLNKDSILTTVPLKQKTYYKYTQNTHWVHDQPYRNMITALFDVTLWEPHILNMSCFIIRRRRKENFVWILPCKSLQQVTHWHTQPKDMFNRASSVIMFISINIKLNSNWTYCYARSKEPPPPLPEPPWSQQLWNKKRS
jgi:hypothetical protein